MRSYLAAIYRFLPVQLVVLHFRKYQLLLFFWVLLVATVTGHFAASFGASSLFLAPEYLNEISFFSMLLMGAAMAVFVMAWHVTTFIIHSHRIPFMGAIRQAFLKYCINNSIIPLVFLTFYSIISIRFQYVNEQYTVWHTIKSQLGFYLGFMLIIMVSFAYFFRVDRNLLKVVLSRITNPSRIREIIPYDTLDYEMDMIKADTFIGGFFRIRKLTELETYHPRLLNTVLRRHHRNAITATIFAITALLLLGIFMEDPKLRVPAGASFLLLFSILMALVGSVKYFLRSWEVIGWILFFLMISLLVQYRVLDLRSIAYGLNYKTKQSEQPIYNYKSLHHIFDKATFYRDKKTEEERLSKWKTEKTSTAKPPLVIITVSGGGSRSAFWTFRSLQYLDSITNGKLFNSTVMLTGASGGMMGASYWRELNRAHQEGTVDSLYLKKYQDNIGKDLLNAIVFSLASVDLISPFNKISLAGYSYTKDRGYAFEQELIRNTDGILDKKLGDYRASEASGKSPLMIINGTIINDGRKLLMSAQPVGYLTQPSFTHHTDQLPPIDGVGFTQFFTDQDPYNLRLTTALRMNATFPVILPVVRLPSQPRMNVMDIGLRDNFGVELASRYLYQMKDWMEENVGDVIFLQIRDNREFEISPPSNMNTLGEMLSGPISAIQQKWEPMQSYYHGYLKEYMPYYMKNNLHFITMQYVPEKEGKAAPLNFHLTTKEQQDLLQSIYFKENQIAVDSLSKLLRQ